MLREKKQKGVALGYPCQKLPGKEKSSESDGAAKRRGNEKGNSCLKDACKKAICELGRNGMKEKRAPPKELRGD